MREHGDIASHCGRGRDMCNQPALLSLARRLLPLAHLLDGAAHDLIKPERVERLRDGHRDNRRHPLADGEAGASRREQGHQPHVHHKRHRYDAEHEERGHPCDADGQLGSATKDLRPGEQEEVLANLPRAQNRARMCAVGCACRQRGAPVLRARVAGRRAHAHW